MSRLYCCITIGMLALCGCRLGPHAPVALLKYEPEVSNGIDAAPSEATSLERYAEIDDYATLHLVLTDPKADPEVIPIAAECALLIVGPTKVFTDVRGDAAKHPELYTSGPRQVLLARAGEAQVSVDALFIDEADMPRAQAEAVFAQIEQRLINGEPFDTVYADVQAQHTYTRDGLTLTRVGNMGRFVLSRSKHNAWPFRWVTVPEAHVNKLLVSLTGSSVICEQNDEPKRVVLYHVREIYRAG